MGKSILANTIATADRTRWRKLSFRSLEPNQIRDRLRYATKAIQEHPLGTSFIIDDLNFDRKPSVYEELLAKFIYAVILRSGRILVTTQGALPMRIMTLHDLPNECNVEIPTLEEDEIRDLAVNHGCPSGHQLKAWTRIIAIQTSRHPLLAHARIKKLEARGWPAHTERDLEAPDELEEIRREIRAHLRELLPSQDARLLAYRLSIIAGRFRRHDALSFGKHDPSIKVPGEAFDSLIGPWVERAGEHYFRLSPLLDGAAEENFTPEDVRGLHRTAAQSFISLGAIGPIELSSILFHGLISEATEPLAQAAMCTFSVEDQYWPDLSAVLDWFANCRLKVGEKLLPGNPLVSTILRRLQFKIVSKSGGQRALTVAAAWEHEIEEWNGSDSYPGSHESMHLMFLTDLLFSFDTPVEIKKIADYVARAIPLGQAAEHFFPGHEPTTFSREDVGRVFNAHTLVGVAIVRCRTASAVIQFLTAVDELSSNDSRVIHQILKDDDRLAALFIDQMWIAEAKIPNPNWNDCLSNIEWVIQFALTKELTAVAVAAYRAKSTVLEEYLHDSEAALDVIEEGEATMGSKHPVLEDYRAKILVMEKRFEEALSVWERALSSDRAPANPVRTFSHRDAEICAGQLGDWKRAGEFALEGAKAARQMLGDVVPENFTVPEVDLMVNGFKADHAYALWKCNDTEAAVKSFAAILGDLEKLPNPNDNLKANMLHKRVGYAIGWFNHDLDGNVEVMEPPPGCFSNPEVHELVKELPMQPLENLWFLLAQIEYKLDIGVEVFRRFEKEITSDSPSSLRAGYADLLLDHSLRSSEPESLVSTFTRCLSDIRASAAERGVKQDQLSLSLLLTSYLFAALVKLISRNEYALAPVGEWRTEAVRLGINSESLNAWLTFVERSISSSHFELVRALYSESSANEIRLVAALVVSASADSNPEERFYANVVLATTNLYDNWLREVENHIGSMISKTWLFVSETQRFALRSPNLNADSIALACKDESCSGLKKAARVLLAARSAVRTSVSDDIFVTLNHKAGYERANSASSSQL
jgi:tetratricopeptide (TPR) repeat protein